MLLFSFAEKKIKYISSMINIKHGVIFLFFTLVVNHVNIAQELNIDYENLDDEELLEIIDNPETENELAVYCSKLYLSRGKNQMDTIKIARGYDRLSRLFEPTTNLIYADSIINLTSHLDNITYPGQAYLLKAWNLKRLGNINASLDNFIIAYYNALESGNVSTEVAAMHYIVYFKTYWGNPREALKLQEKMLNRINTDEFLNSLIPTFRVYDYEKIIAFRKALVLDAKLNLLTSHLELGDYDKIENSLDSLIIESEKNNYYESYIGFLELKMELAFHLKNFNQCIELADQVIRLRQKYYNNYPLRPNLVYFKGKSLWELGNNERAIASFMSADSLYQKDHNLLFPRHRDMYRYLLEWFKNKDSISSQIYYLNRLIKIDSIYLTNYSKLDPKIIDQFQTPKLLAEKEELIAQLEWEKGREKRKKLLIGLLLALSIASTTYYFWKQRQYKTRFKTLVDQGLKERAVETVNSKRNGISADIVDDILKRLEVFEGEHQYTAQDISLQSVAKKFGTNSSYLSKVSNLKKDKNFSQYISELRISYAVQEMQHNPRFRKYTIKAIAEEVGFGNAQSFSKAFYARTGIHPSYFIRNLNKQLD